MLDRRELIKCAGLAALGTSLTSATAFALDTARDPAAIHADPTGRVEFQRRLLADGVPLYWLIDVGVDDPAFAGSQIAAMGMS